MLMESMLTHGAGDVHLTKHGEGWYHSRTGINIELATPPVVRAVPFPPLDGLLTVPRVA